MSIRFEFEKETKGAVRYKESAEEPVIGTLYIRKARLKEFGLDGREAILLEIRKEKGERNESDD